MKTHAAYFLVGLFSMTTVACQLQTLEAEPGAESTSEEPSSCADESECAEDPTHDETDGDGAEAAAEGTEPESESDEPTSSEEESDAEMEAQELELVVARPIVEDEPVRATFCGEDLKNKISYRNECQSLERECSASGGVFLCHDSRSSDECRTWGGCHFLSLQAKPIEPTPLPEGLGVSSGNDGGLADTSEFGCGESKGCCLFVPGAGDSSVDCGGFLASCELIGCQPSGGNHAASCQC